MVITCRFKPERTAVLAFGHDEEVAGDGASSMARLLKQRVSRFKAWFKAVNGCDHAERSGPARAWAWPACGALTADHPCLQLPDACSMWSAYGPAIYAQRGLSAA